MLHICLVTFISFISNAKVHLLISCTIIQLIHFHLIHFTDHSLSHSHSRYLVLLILHRISTSLSLSFFNQSRLWKLGVSLDKTLIQKIYYIILKLDSDAITTPCHFIRITTWCQSKATHIEDSYLQSRFMLVLPVNVYKSLIICYLLLHHG